MSLPSVLPRPRPAAAAALAALAASAVFAFGGLRTVALVEQRHEALVTSRVAESGSSVYGILESELTATLHLARGLVGLVAYDPALDGLDDGTGPVTDALAEVHTQGEHLRNIGLAPGNELVHVYPLAGNEEAMGLRYEDRPAQWPAVERAMRTGETVLAGPVDLVQGGRGLVNRTPVVIDGEYWGIISLVVDVDSLVAAIDRATGDAAVDWAVRTVPVAGGQPTPVTGDQTLFDAEARRLEMPVPGGRWELAFSPSTAAMADAPPLTLLRVVVLATAAVVGVLVAVALGQRERFRELSLHDTLTGLPNRRLLLDRMQLAARNADRGDGAAVLVLDLDGFKALNDAFGHEVGDDALRDTASRLLATARGADTVARTGGDEFVVVLPDTSLPAARDVVAPRLLAAVTTTRSNGRVDCPISATIGLAHTDIHGRDIAELLRMADAALYDGKRQGRGRVVVAVPPPAHAGAPVGAPAGSSGPPAT